MTAAKLSIEVGEQSVARDIVAFLNELLEPPPLATTQFEDGNRWRVESYGSDAEHCRAMLSRLLEAGRPVGDSSSIVGVEDADWVARSQAALPPVVAGRFTVHGKHDRARVPRGPNSIEIEAGEAFGTGHHATTRCCLLALDALARRHNVRRVLDLGCGSGVLAIASAMAWPRAEVVASDVDPVAIATAQANRRLNGLGRRIEFLVTNGVPRSSTSEGGRPDLIVANILAGPLTALAGSLAATLRPSGVVILSGLLTYQAPPLAATYRAHGFSIRRHAREAGWSTLVLVRRGTLYRSAERLAQARGTKSSRLRTR